MKTIKMSKKHFDEIINTNAYYGPRFQYWYESKNEDGSIKCNRKDVLNGEYRGSEYVKVIF